MAVFRNTPPEYEKKQIAPYSAPRALTASATQIDLSSISEADQFRKRRQSSTHRWQEEAWEYFDAIGEIKFAFTLSANVVSRIQLYAAYIEDPAAQPVSVRDASGVDPEMQAAAERAIARLTSKSGGQAGMIKSAAMNLSIAGECYLVQIPPQIALHLPESWEIVSVDELQVNNKNEWYITRKPGMKPGDPGSILIPDGSFMGRLWHPHARYADDADSSMKGILDLCAESLLLSRLFRGTEKSRLNAGMIYLPDGLSVAAGPDPEYPYDDGIDPSTSTAEEAGDEFEDQFIDAIITPISDEESASSVSPLIVRGPAELAESIKQFSFARAYDETLTTRATDVISRILSSIDVPKDMIQGNTVTRYANQVDESLYRAHIEPQAMLICDALTQIYLRPYLLALGYDPLAVNRLVIWYDPSQISTRTDRAADADNGYAKGILSSSTWRKAHGFTDLDAPPPNEIALQVLIAKGLLTPELTESMLDAVAPDIMGVARQADQAASIAPVPPGVDGILGQPGAGGAPATPGAPSADGTAAAPAGPPPPPGLAGDPDATGATDTSTGDAGDTGAPTGDDNSSGVDTGNGSAPSAPTADSDDQSDTSSSDQPSDAAAPTSTEPSSTSDASDTDSDLPSDNSSTTSPESDSTENAETAEAEQAPDSDSEDDASEDSGADSDSDSDSDSDEDEDDDEDEVEPGQDAPAFKPSK